MLRSYRGVFAAIAGLILLGASPSNDRQAGQNQQTSAARERTGAPSTLHEANAADASTQPCKEGENNRSSDLCAQWKAADAAQSAADATWFFGVFGTVIGFLTLGAAIAAAFYARSAAVHSDISHKAFVTAERAIVRVVSAHQSSLSGGQERDIIAVRFKNVGRTATRITKFGSKTTGSAPRWLDIGPGCEEAIAGPEIPADQNVVLVGWFWIEYTIIGGGTGEANFQIKGYWRPDDGFASARWVFEVSNVNGHPDDT